jgi:hypothetical protein
MSFARLRLELGLCFDSLLGGSYFELLVLNRI